MTPKTRGAAYEPRPAQQTITGNEIIALTLRRLEIETVFFLMGGPMIDCEVACERQGIRMIDVRHEQAAAMMATAYARLRRRPAVCMAASGPGVANLVTGIANAWADGAPVIAIGGAAPMAENNMLSFQQVDQVALFEPITRWSDRCYDARRLPEYLQRAVALVVATPGPVYVDVPADALYGEVPVEEVRWIDGPSTISRPHGDPKAIERAAELIVQARQPILIYGTGVHWSDADQALNDFVDATRIPFYATPQGRGVVSETHPVSFLGARGTAFAHADLIVQVGTRQSYVVDHLRPPRWNGDAQLVQIDLDSAEIGRNRTADVGIVGDAGAVLAQLTAAVANRIGVDHHEQWLRSLAIEHQAKAAALERRMSVATRPIHPLRLCRAVRDCLPSDGVLVVDGQEILNYARQSIPFQAPRSLNSGPFGTMGVGLPLGLGAKLALPDAPVLVLHGDGSFGINAMEMDTAVRHGIAIVCVISNNGGWTAADRPKAGRFLGFTRYDLMFAPLGVHTEHVEDPDRLEGAIGEALASGGPALINVITDPQARASGAKFASYLT